MFMSDINTIEQDCQVLMENTLKKATAIAQKFEAECQPKSTKTANLYTEDTIPDDGLSEDGVSSLLPPLPLNAFLPAEQRIITGISNHGNIDLSISGAAYLSSVSAFLGQSRLLRLPNAWTVAGNLFILLVSESDTGKSVGCEPYFANRDYFEDLLFNKYKSDLARYSVELELYEAEVAARKKQIRSGVSIDFINFDLERPVEPAQAKIFLEDVTPEAIRDAVVAYPKGCCLRSEEASILLANRSSYNNDKSKVNGLLCKASDRSSYDVLRVGKTPIRIKHLCLSLFGEIQPAILAKNITAEDVFCGFLPRVAFVRAPISKFKGLTREPLSDFVVNSLFGLQKHLFEIEYDENVDVCVGISDSAFGLFEQFMTNLMDDKFYSVQSRESNFNGKFCTLCLKLANVLNQTRSFFEKIPDTSDVDLTVMQRAIELTLWFKAHSESILMPLIGSQSKQIFRQPIDRAIYSFCQENIQHLKKSNFLVKTSTLKDAITSELGKISQKKLPAVLTALGITDARTSTKRVKDLKAYCINNRIA